MNRAILIWLLFQGVMICNSYGLEMIVTSKQFKLNEVPNGSETSFKDGDHIYVYLKGEVGQILINHNTLFVGLRLPSEKNRHFTYVSIITEELNFSDEVLEIPLVPNPETMKNADISYVVLNFTNLQPKKYSFMVDLYSHIAASKRIIASEKVKLDVSAGCDEYKQLHKALTIAERRLRLMPPELYENQTEKNSLIELLNQFYSGQLKRNVEIVNAYFIDENWTVVVNEFGQAKRRWITAAYGFKEKEKCLWNRIQVFQLPVYQSEGEFVDQMRIQDIDDREEQGIYCGNVPK